MKRYSAFLFVTLMVFFACSKSKQEIYGEPVDPAAKAVTLKELLSHPQAFEEQVVVVEGRLGNLCPDGEDFYFKDKLETIEVIPPKNAAPPHSKIGSRMKVWGAVLVKTEIHEEAGESSESHEGEAAEHKGQAAEGQAAGEESEVKIAAKGMEVLP